MVNHPTVYREKVSQLITWGHWFCLANIILALICGLRYLILAKPPETFLGQFYLLASWMGQFAFLPFIVFLLTLFPLSFVIPSNRSLRIIGAAIATLGIGLLVLDTEFFSTFNLHLNPALFKLLVDKQYNTEGSSLNLLFVTLPLLFMLELWIAKLCWKYQRRLDHSKSGLPIAGVFFCCFLFTHLGHAWADATQYQAITQQKNNYPLFYPLTARSFLQQQGIFDVEAYQKRLQADQRLEAGQLRYPLQAVESEQGEQRLNVLLIVAEGLQAKMLNQQAMPATWKQAQRSSQFFNHYSGGNSAESGIYSLFYSLPSNYWPHLKQAQRQPVLLDILQQHNYQLNWFDRPLERSAGSVPSKQLREAFTLHQPSDNDADVVRAWRNWQNSQQAQLPWFNLVYLRGAGQFEAPQQIDNLNDDAINQQYQAAVTKLDENLSAVFQQLRQDGLAENTIIILTADHGNQLSGFGHQQLSSASNFSQLQTQVPMLIHWPARAPSLNNGKTSHLDLAPTLLERLFEVKTPRSAYSSGDDIFLERKKRWLLLGNGQEQAIVDQNYITLLGSNGGYQVFDYKMQASNDSLSMPVMVQALNELKRFYQPEPEAAKQAE